MILHAWRDGWQRVAAAPAIAAGVFGVTLLAALPLALAMRDLLRTHLGSSLMASGGADGVNYDWWQEFLAQTQGIGATFTPAILGFAATLDALSAVADAEGQIAPITTAVALYIAGWTFLIGGILDRYARQQRTRAHGFFQACGVFFFRFLRLAAPAALFYSWMFVAVHPWLFGAVYGALTRDLAVERTAFFLRAALYIVFGALLALGNLVFDFAKVRAVVEDRRSMLGAVRASVRFIAQRPGRCTGLYALNTMTFVALLGVWGMTAPAVTSGGAGVWVGLAGSQAYLLARLLLKLQFLASEVALFQRCLAHARYTATPEPVWPDSPAAASISSAPLR